MNKLKDKIDKLGLDFKKEVLLFTCLNMALLGAIAAGFIFLDLIYAIITILIAVFINILYFYRYVLIKDKINEKNEEQFITLINYLEIFLSNQMNVYNALNNVKQYCNEYVAHHLDILIEQIDEDKTIKPYITFAKAFKTSIYEDIMIAIYQMSVEGESAERLNQFDFQFQRIKENDHQLQINKKARQLDTLSTYPLICSAYVTIVLTFSILLIMGDIINVF